ncbi:hypothetical protein AB0758_45550 [Tolypothrix bouteillei VB521301_2]|uniref:Uncharacterized protein n=1 Tax=Tolypothrix bouteillei VB521301 TaxID=1479485 RepID=A0A0C1NM92_9CYAN
MKGSPHSGNEQEPNRPLNSRLRLFLLGRTSLILYAIVLVAIASESEKFQGSRTMQNLSQQLFIAPRKILFEQ